MNGVKKMNDLDKKQWELMKYYTKTFLYLLGCILLISILIWWMF